MNKRLIKLLFIPILTLSSLFVSNPSVYANEKEPTLSLVGENYSNSTLVREYRDINNKEYIDTFLIPEHLVPNIQLSADKLKEAKKVLFLYYTFKEDNATLDRLKNQTFYKKDYKLKISEEYSGTFHSDLASSLEFVQNHASNQTIKKKYLAHEVENNFNDSLNEQKEKTTPIDTKEGKNDSSNRNSFSYLFIAIPITLILIGIIVFRILSRR